MKTHPCHCLDALLVVQVRLFHIMVVSSISVTYFSYAVIQLTWIHNTYIAAGSIFSFCKFLQPLNVMFPKNF